MRFSNARLYHRSVPRVCTARSAFFRAQARAACARFCAEHLRRMSAQPSWSLNGMSSATQHRELASNACSNGIAAWPPRNLAAPNRHTMTRRPECRHAQAANAGLAHRSQPAAANELFARYKWHRPALRNEVHRRPHSAVPNAPARQPRITAAAPTAQHRCHPTGITIATSPSSHDTRPGPASQVSDRSRLPSEAPQRKSVTNLHSKCAPRSTAQQRRHPRRPKLSNDYQHRLKPGNRPSTNRSRTEKRSSRVLQTCVTGILGRGGDAS